MTIVIEAGGRRYEAIVGAGLRRDCGRLMAERGGGPRCAVVADEATAKLFADEVMASLSGAGLDPMLATVPRGEEAKSLEVAGAICNKMAEAGLDRKSFVVALGGGAVGDLAGFAAGIFLRGIAHVQMPTTLLAQVDSAIGGKTAVNTAYGKNLLGVVHQPALVLADVETLETLSTREFNQGFAEIIKHAVIADPALLDLLDADLVTLVARNLRIKAAIVARDEHDTTGERAVLNFGHTVGHAIERAAGYGRFLHGEAISLGMVAACEVSVRRAGMPEADRKRVVQALEQRGLPVRLPPGIARSAILEAVKADKKFERGEVRFVVTPGLGAAHLSAEITRDDVACAIAEL